MSTATSHKLVTTTVPRYNWVPDSQRKRCVNKVCNSKFTTAVRRHHCRFCGEIFCAKCLSKHKGYLACEACRETNEGKVIMHESKKDRKTKAKMAVADLRTKISAERTKTPDESGTTARKTKSTPAARGGSTNAVRRASGGSSGTVNTPAAQKAPTTPKTAELAAGGNPRQATEHTATFSTAPSRKPQKKDSDLFTSPSSPMDDPFSTGGDADEFDSDDEDLADGDIGGDITTQATSRRTSSSQIAADDSDDDQPDHGDDDFAAMLAAADDLQDDGA